MNKQGFTLVELIVVIAIIAVLSVTGFISYQGYIADSRDSKRIETLSSLQSAVMAFNAKEGRFPMCDSGNNCNFTAEAMRDNDWPKLAINGDPVDPRKDINDNPIHFYYWSDGNDFELAGILEKDSGSLYVVGTSATNGTGSHITDTAGMQSWK